MGIIGQELSDLLLLALKENLMLRADKSKYSHILDLRGKQNADNYLRAGWEVLGTYAGLSPLGKGQTTLTYRLGWPIGAGEPLRPEIDERQLEPGPSAN